jgi:uncharacterized membrane protein
MSLPLGNDAIVLGLLICVLAGVFVTAESNHPTWKKFYSIVPPLLLCYFIPALLHWPLGWISGESSSLYKMASRYLLPASLVFLCLSIDLKGVLNLGSKALIMFFTATFGVILGGPLALLFVLKVAPGLVGYEADELWRGFSTIAGSWIGGGANQAAMKEIFNVSTKLFSSMVVVDVIVANVWMAALLYGAANSSRIDGWLKADNSAIEKLRQDIESYSDSVKKIPSTTDMFVLLAVGFGAVALSHLGADLIMPLLEKHEATLKAIYLESIISSFFWIVLIATTLGLLVSFTRLRALEGVGASRMGSVFIYILVATIGMQMNIKEVFEAPGLFLVGVVWMLVHVSLLLFVAWLIKAPFFFVAVGSQANIGGAASAPVVASAFSPALAPVGVLLAVLGYALGTYGALISAFLMRAIVGG